MNIARQFSRTNTKHLFKAGFYLLHLSKERKQIAFTVLFNLIPCSIAQPLNDLILTLLFEGALVTPRSMYWENCRRFSFFNKMFAWVWLYSLQSWNSAESVNPGTLCDGRALRAQHSPLWGRLLFFPVMSILLGISASLHTTCCAQQCGEARASRVVVSACQSQSQGSVSSHQSEKPYPDVACLPSPHVQPPYIGCPFSITCCQTFHLFTS